METLEELCRRAHQSARDWKALRVQEDGRDAHFPFLTTCYRGSELVATVFPVNRDLMLWSARLAVGGFGCDRVAATVDAYGVRGLDRHPETGQPWQPGDFQKAFAARKPWVHEALKTYAIDRVEGQLHAIASQYKAKHRRIRFDEPDEIPDAHESGMVPRVLRQAMSARDLEVLMDEHLRKAVGQPSREVFAGLTPRQRRLHSDVATVRLYAIQNVPVLYATHDDEASELVDKSLTDQEFNRTFGVELNVEKIGP